MLTTSTSGRKGDGELVWVFIEERKGGREELCGDMAGGTVTMREGWRISRQSRIHNQGQHHAAGVSEPVNLGRVKHTFVNAPMSLLREFECTEQTTE
jgi:hypothetical protein